jgi:hypothetical protein
MRKQSAALAALFLVMAGAQGRAAGTDLEFFTGADLYQQCSTNAADADFAARQARCTGYVLGVSDSLQAGQGSGRPGKICIQSTNTAGQLSDAVKQYLADHADKQSMAAQDLVAEALVSAFPCS